MLQKEGVHLFVVDLNSDLVLKDEDGLCVQYEIHDVSAEDRNKLSWLLDDVNSPNESLASILKKQVVILKAGGRSFNFRNDVLKHSLLNLC